ncbi:hypothetical protein I0C86_01485 [Plantactinospora sp. S1510]|uniref:Glycerophosphoryl diester phosphodiesterase membrane domain-containing protein n=1 Tax=Plantactinospora alkalitolerans TaxID=2789879 RepID=A0ABS0GNB3_9ACTN|nr:hypothetical protein [Plantactinospora alkalitolerans]MBF9127675.1 hypothetical protein [Plantactinospora alkalitolerans]
MPDAGPTAVLPLRPLTIGELIDSAVLLLRDHARVLVPVALLLTVLEQLLLYPPRLAAGVEPPGYLPDINGLTPYWFLLAVGAATETVIIALLGNLSARAAGTVLLEPAGPVRPMRLLHPKGARFAVTALVALLAGGIMFVAALAMPAWLIGFALLGAVVPAITLDRVGPFRALVRSGALALRSVGRAGGVRLLGYLVWWIVRVGLAVGIVSGLGSVGLLDPDWKVPASLAVWAAVNSVAYPAIACLDAVIYLETRIRTEGLDIVITRARQSGRPLISPMAGHR